MRVRRTPAGLVELTFRRGAQTDVRTHDAVVIAVPFSTLRLVDLDASLALPLAQRQAIANLGYGTNAKMMVGFSARLGHARQHRDSYADLPNDQTTWETNPLRATATQAILTDYSGAERGATLNALPPQIEAEHFLGDLDQVYPGAAAAATRSGGGRRGCRNWTSNPLTMGSYTCYPPGSVHRDCGAEGPPAGNRTLRGRAHQLVLRRARLHGGRGALRDSGGERDPERRPNGSRLVGPIVDEERSDVTMATLLSELRHNPLLWLLVLVPVVFVAQSLAPEAHTLLFVLSVLAIVPLATLLSHATESVAAKTGDTVGGLLNATLGNLTELVIALAALRSGQYMLVKASIAGAIVTNSLFMLGASFLLGGLKYHMQEFNRVSARLQASLLFLATIGLLIPSAIRLADGGPSAAFTQQLSLGLSGVTHRCIRARHGVLAQDTPRAVRRGGRTR